MGVTSTIYIPSREGEYIPGHKRAVLNITYTLITITHFETLEHIITTCTQLRTQWGPR